MVHLEHGEAEQSHMARLCITQIWALPCGTSTVGTGLPVVSLSKHVAAGESGVRPLELGDQSKE